ncbi:MAG: alcohol dehydrogenase catalytic domain-containing protein, partial [Cyanobacteria bacterium P01_A01_bin.40]
MVKMARFHKFGDPDVLQFDELPLNDPGEAEVLVRVSAMSLNRADLLWMENNYVETPELPAKLGYEIVGTVEGVGSKVTEFEIGDRVSSIPAFSISDYGNFGESTILPARGLMKTPDNFSGASGCSFAFSYFTGYFALLELGQLQAYQTVLITAGTSTTGLAAIAIA